MTWLYSEPPTLAADPDPGALSVGTEFYVTEPGFQATKIRYPQSPEAAGQSLAQRQCAIYSTSNGITGTLVAGPFTMPTPTPGTWVEFTLPQPFPLTPNTRYRVSVFHPQGKYPSSRMYYGGNGPGATNLVQGALVRPNGVNSLAGHQGTYFYDSVIGFPNDSFNASAYFSDVEVVPTTGGGTPATLPGTVGVAASGGGEVALRAGATGQLATTTGTASTGGGAVTLAGAGTFTAATATAESGAGTATMGGGAGDTLTTESGAGSAHGNAAVLAAAARFTAATAAATATGGTATLGGGQPGQLFTQTGTAETAGGLVNLAGVATFTGILGAGDAAGGLVTLSGGTGTTIWLEPADATAHGGTATLTTTAQLTAGPGTATAAGGTILWTRPQPHPARTLTIPNDPRTLEIRP